MRVFLQPPQESRGLQRIADALARYAPAGVEVTSFHDEADLVVIYAIGRRDRIQGQVAHLLDKGRKYAMVQVCLRSTMSPDTRDWLSIWERAVVVWSYYDLFSAALDDGVYVQGMDNVLHAPLGVDSSVFYPRDEKREFTVLTSGLSRLSESVRECWLAVEQATDTVNDEGYTRPSVHLGPLDRKGVKSLKDISDNELAEWYSRTQFVSGLRRKEGFELPAAEGLLCGARPILFDTPDYRWNYKEWGEYIHEGTRQEVVDQLVQLFKQGARPVTEHEREEAAHWFNWERVCGEFWARCLN